MQWLLRLLPGPQPLLIRYAVTLAMVLVTFAVRLAMRETAGPYGFILYVPAMLAASLLFDRGSGFLALALTAALTASIIPWESNFGIHLAALVIFAAISVPLVLIAEGLHKALEEAHEARRAQALLLAEMTHRVRNKFAMILSLIGLQARQSQPETRQALEAIAQRVRVIANMHEHLQMARHDNLVEISEYLRGLCKALQETVRELRPVTVNVNAQPMSLEQGIALSVGLITNELVTNAFKYAFTDGRAGHVSVDCKNTGDGLELSVTDDGVGCPDDSEPGLGTRLVTLLVDQLGGAIKREHLDSGCRVSVTMPTPSAAPAWSSRRMRD